MPFWEELRDKVKQNKLGTGITLQALSKIDSVLGGELIGVKPAYSFGQLYTLSLDFMQFVEDLLQVDPADKRGVVRGVLCVREAASSLLSCVKGAGASLDALVLALDEHYQQSGSEETADDEESGDIDEFAPEEAELAGKVEAFLGRSGNESSARGLARTIAGIYRECVHFAQAVSELRAAKDGDIEALLGILLDIQYGLEGQTRVLIEDDVLTDHGVSFSPGLLTWSGLALNELIPLLPETKTLMQVPIPEGKIHLTPQ